MKFKIKKFSAKKAKKAKKAVKDSSKIEGYKETKNRSIKIRANKIASRLCS